MTGTDSDQGPEFHPPVESAEVTPYAFLSSPVKDSSSATEPSPDPTLRQVRESIHNLSLPDGKTIWVDEVDKPRCLNPASPSFPTLDELFRLIRKSSVFLVLLGGSNYGTSLRIENETVHVSYWEIELFYAALTRKPVQVFEIEGFKPEPKLAALLALLRDALPKKAWSGPHSRKEVPSVVHKFLVAQIQQKGTASSPRNFLGRLVDGFLNLRGQGGLGGAAEQESTQFILNGSPDPTVEFKETVVSRLFQEVRGLPDEEGRLTRLWIVYRQLQGAASHGRDGSEILPYWNRLYAEWSSAGSWYGLHGHPHLAVHWALTMQAKVRAQMRELGSSAWKEEDTCYPGGALASSRYSIARRAGSLRARRFLLRAALVDLERSLTEGTQDTANLLAIRGSVYRRLGAIRAAVDDYEQVVHIRQRSGAPNSAIGEALSELGYGYLFQLRFWRGRSLLEEGVRLLSAGSSRSGFLIRATRKLAVAYALTGHPKQARDVLRAAIDSAHQHNVFDQVR